MKVGVIAPASRGDAMKQARKAVELLLARDAVVLTEEETLPMLPGCDILSPETPVDTMICLGGDGTLLRCAQYAALFDAPLLGINMGRLGFLSETEPEMLEAALDALFTGQYATECRAMLSVEIPGQGRWYALNDAVMTRGGYARLITMNALVDGEKAGSYLADGLIIATPTGSTGYSLSAGGPIVSPHVDCMVITPVCAHSLQHRPVVVHGSAEITVELHSDDEMAASLQIDGQNCAELKNGQRVMVRKAERCVKLIRLKDARFFEVVRRKLAQWSC